jgi:hypothetical protein
MEFEESRTVEQSPSKSSNEIAELNSKAKESDRLDKAAHSRYQSKDGPGNKHTQTQLDV